jgi:hypothetical protein
MSVKELLKKQKKAKFLLINAQSAVISISPMSTIAKIVVARDSRMRF